MMVEIDYDNFIDCTEQETFDVPFEGFKSLDEELDDIEYYVYNNPYPDYEEMIEKLEKHWQMQGEYGEDNHEWCQTMYYNIWDDDCIYEMGKNIYEKGGLYAMIQNYHTLVQLSPFADSQNTIIRNYCKRISIIWEEIGGWKF